MLSAARVSCSDFKKNIMSRHIKLHFFFLINPNIGLPRFWGSGENCFSILMFVFVSKTENGNELPSQSLDFNDTFKNLVLRDEARPAMTTRAVWGGGTTPTLAPEMFGNSKLFQTSLVIH